VDQNLFYVYYQEDNVNRCISLNRLWELCISYIGNIPDSRIVHILAVDIGTYMTNCDISEMFLNFMLDENLRKYAGVDLTELFLDESSGKTFWERWERLLMVGFKPLPCLTTRLMQRIERNFLKGKMDDPENVFRWSSVVY
jgi:hypothetical protein